MYLTTYYKRSCTSLNKLKNKAAGPIKRKLTKALSDNDKFIEICTESCLNILIKEELDGGLCQKLCHSQTAQYHQSVPGSNIMKCSKLFASLLNSIVPTKSHRIAKQLYIFLYSVCNSEK